MRHQGTTRDEHGATTSELFCLATTLLDPTLWPIEEFPALYHERWRAETLLDAVKTDLRGGPDVLTRSQSPAGTRQEIWALFCLYQALADLVGDAARPNAGRQDRDCGESSSQCCYRPAAHWPSRSSASGLRECRLWRRSESRE